MDSTGFTQEYILQVRKWCVEHNHYCNFCPRKNIRLCSTVERCIMDFNLELATLVLELLERK